VIASASHSRLRRRQLAFSIVEVVLALGVIGVGVVAILGVFPTALQTGHSAQDETRAPQIAQTIFSSLVAQASSQFNNLQLPIAGNPSLPINLTLSSSPSTPTLYADNDGKLRQDATAAAYAILIFTCNPSNCASPPAGFNDPTLNQVTVRVAWPANAPAANQTYRDYVRIISKY
jgi:uncharacterized protein (TIGR02598 family)